jgi:hypothetical protein
VHCPTRCRHKTLNKEQGVTITGRLETQHMDLYIYYRVRGANTPALRARLDAMQRSVFLEYGIVSGVKRRPEEKNGLQTWMEIYQAVPAGFEAKLEQAVMQAELATLIDGQRHTEHFVDVSSCA